MCDYKRVKKAITCYGDPKYKDYRNVVYAYMDGVNYVFYDKKVLFTLSDKKMNRVRFWLLKTILVFRSSSNICEEIIERHNNYKSYCEGW